MKYFILILKCIVVVPICTLIGGLFTSIPMFFLMVCYSFIHLDVSNFYFGSECWEVIRFFSIFGIILGFAAGFILSFEDKK